MNYAGPVCLFIPQLVTVSDSVVAIVAGLAGRAVWIVTWQFRCIPEEAVHALRRIRIDPAHQFVSRGDTAVCLVDVVAAHRINTGRVFCQKEQA